MDRPPETKTFLEDVLDGLSQPQKSISPKYFYDRHGSVLFEQICELPEYYPTRSELSIMEEHGPRMAALIGPRCQLIEPGSGSSLKTRHLIDQLKGAVSYVPVDISGEHLKDSAAALQFRYPGIAVQPVHADFTEAFTVPQPPRAAACRVVFFPGSTIGNFTPLESEALLGRLAGLVSRKGGPETWRPTEKSHGGLLIGVDLKKEADILNAAYNDAAGVTAAFNLNLLHRMKRELGAAVDVANFEHRAFYNGERGRIEMHLASLVPQAIDVGGRSFSFEAGETIHTENSYKYSVEEFQALCRRAGFSPVETWTDERGLFSVHYFEAGGK